MVILGGLQQFQLCNLLFLSSHFMANSIEYKYRLVIINELFRKKYLDKFEHKFNSEQLNKKYRPLIIYNKFLNSILKIARKFKIGIYNPMFGDNNHLLNEDAKFLKLAKKNIAIIGEWQFRDFKNVKKHYDSIKEFFTPTDEYRLKIEQFIKSIKKEDELLIGVHIRLGDYKEWQDGKFYYSVDSYIKKMREVQSIFNDKNIKFLICSNEKLDEKPFIDASLNFTFGLNGAIEDLYSFSKCDYLIGPPSTYSSWASFYGRVPLCFIYDMNIKIDKDLFEIVEG